MKISNEELKEIGQILIAASEGKPLQYHMDGSDNPWEDFEASAELEMWHFSCHFSRTFRVGTNFYGR